MFCRLANSVVVCFVVCLFVVSKNGYPYHSYVMNVNIPPLKRRKNKKKNKKGKYKIWNQTSSCYNNLITSPYSSFEQQVSWVDWLAQEVTWMLVLPFASCIIVTLVKSMELTTTRRLSYSSPSNHSMINCSQQHTGQSKTISINYRLF